MAYEITAGAAVLIFFAGMLHASVTDLKHRRIANWVILAMMAAWVPMAMLAQLPGDAVMGSLSVMVLVFIAGFGCFCMGWLGGGDVKLAAVAALWLGPAMVPAFIMLATIFGALIALVFIGVAYVKRRGGADMQTDRMMLPYGPGLASAAVVLFGESQWFALAT